MHDAVAQLQALEPQHRFLVGIDSDGCAFDTMEVKHKECFIPCTINVWNLQAVSKYAREAAEFVNLYSKWRGINRFPALLRTFDLLAEWDEVRKRGTEIPRVPNLRDWVARETKLANPALEKATTTAGHEDLMLALRWSKSVNESIESLVRGVPPFPFVRESLAKISQVADIVVVSATPGEALRREWEEHEIAQYTRMICGQEVGTKKQMLGWLKDHYEPNHVLMIGDAPGDLEAAHANSAMFYPVNPGAEDASWERFCDDAFNRFIQGVYRGGFESDLIAEFDAYLPERPPWKLDSSA